MRASLMRGQPGCAMRPHARHLAAAVPTGAHAASHRASSGSGASTSSCSSSSSVLPAISSWGSSRQAGSRQRPVVAVRVQGFFQNLTGGNKKPDDGRPSVESMGLDYYDKDEVEHYFNYMGCLATEGTYDRMEALLTSGLHPANVILLLAAQENDTPKVVELLSAGADLTVRDNKGKGPMDLATKPETLDAMKQHSAAKQ